MNEDIRPVIVPPRPRRGRPPTRRQQVGSLDEMVTDRGPAAAAADAIAAELLVMEPQTPVMLQRRTKYRREIIDEALQEPRFRKTGGGYALVDFRR